MNDTVTVIDIVAQVTDETDRGARSAESNVSKLERSMMKLQKQIQGMKGKSKLEVAATLKDMASKGLQNVAAAGKKIAGKVWTVTLKAVDLVTAPFKKVLGLLASPVTQAAAFAGVSFGVADTINTFKDFEQGMANVKAISGATGEEFDALSNTAKQLGESTMFSAAQAAEAMENLAMAGWKSKDIVAGMPGLLDLAAAGSVDLATAADVTSSALAQFKLDASESARVADVLAATATNSKTDIAGLGESLKMAGTQAGALGYSIEDAALAIGLMGNAGVDASSAGTALRSTLARMAKQEGLSADESNAVTEAMDKVGVSLTDAQGKSKSLMTVMKELRAGFKGMTETEKAATAANLAGMYAQSGLLAIVDASDEKFDELAAAIANAEGAASEMAKTKMDTLQGSLYYLQSAAEGVKIAIGEKLKPYVKDLVDWVTAHMPDIQNAVGGAVDFITGKIDSVMESIKSLTGSQEWQNAETLWDKIKLAWDKLIAEPFDAWWSGTGKSWLAEKANSIGEGLGTAIKTGILALLGVDVTGVAADGMDIGKSFFDGFMDGFDWSEVSKRLGEALKDGLKFLFKDAATLLPGGEEASGTSALSAAALGYGALKVGQVGYKAYKGGKAVVNGVKTAGDVVSGVKIFNAAANGSHAAESALGMAQAGQLGAGTSFGATIAPAVNKLAKAAPILAGVTSAVQMGADAYHGTQKAEEWTGSDSTGSKVASGIGAAVGGLGDGILGDESLLRKASNVGGGALKGAGIGAAVGSILPGVGTAIGGAVGAGVGAAGAAIGGSNIAKALSAAGEAVGGFFTKTVPEKFGELTEGAESFFTETVPAKFEDLATGAESFLTETVPFAVGYAAGKIQTFFTETVPEFFGNLWDGIRSFFTETVPAAIETVGGALGTFFFETVPQFFSDLWTGITTFFTEDVPQALETVGAALSTFFTETIPAKMQEVWDGVVNVFTKKIPEAVSSIGESISGFFNNVKEKISGFFGGLWNKVTGSASAGYQAAAAHAEGGIMTSPHVGLVAEDGAEAIIPLSGKRRERGIELWEQTGNLLGVKPYADGAIVGNAEPVPDTGPEPVIERSKSSEGNGGNGSMAVPVTIENLTFEINVSGSNAPDAQAIVNTIREQVRGMTDEIAYQLAVALKQSFANTPKEQWGG